MTKKIDFNISIIRVLSMLSIIGGHLLSMYGINHFQFGAIGVEIFLFISGYLYSKKNISNIKEWIINRCTRLIVPYWIVLSGVIVLRFCFKYEVTLDAVAVFALNMQGVDKIFREISLPALRGMGQTWFLTVLILCYGIMLFLKKNEHVEKFIRKNIKVIFLFSVILQLLLSAIHIQIIRPLCFFYGYFWADSKLDVSKNKYIKLTIFMIVFTVLRFITHMFYDQSVIYDYVVFGWSFVILAVWLIFTAVKFFNHFSGIREKMVNKKSWLVIDLMTYPLFLTHYMFASGEFAVINWVKGIFGQLIVFFAITIITASIVLIISDYKKVKKIVFDI
ncbi:MAG: acyltransferase family protein [Clostridium sp.]|uniref:acyltransferase family protein n=1 Tax=Clostridium sp. TaxID=1506 RepID=UPI00290E7DB0|nr:acyltransferase family protein [Clostridium sp.]MDU5741519.1 acyltransferase family protein [Clostridium sp.]MDU5785973.1 acyltransferase family protein [Clostridium sp.]